MVYEIRSRSPRQIPFGTSHDLLTNHPVAWRKFQLVSGRHDAQLSDRGWSCTSSYPAYLPDEMKLIRAEVAARENRLLDALGFVNAVRTPCTSALPEPVACLPALLITDVPTQAAMLAQILEERRVELYLQHVRWSDLRRFGLTPKFMWMPIPGVECDRNAATPDELCQDEPAFTPHDS